MADPIWNARNWGVYQRAFPDMDWRKKWRTQNLGLASDRVTPKYDIDIGQHGKPRRDEKLNILRIAPSGPSGHHPGFESGYQGGVRKAIPSPTLEGGVEVTIEGGNAGLDAYPNKIPTVRQRKIPRTWRGPGDSAQIPQYDDTMGAGVATKKKGPTAEERAEAWKQAMADAQGFMAPMQGDTIPGAIVGEKTKIQTGPYETGGYDLTSNRPISDTDAVRKRLYGIMGFA